MALRSEPTPKHGTMHGGERKLWWDRRELACVHSARNMDGGRVFWQSRAERLQALAGKCAQRNAAGSLGELQVLADGYGFLARGQEQVRLQPMLAII